MPSPPPHTHTHYMHIHLGWTLTPTHVVPCTIPVGPQVCTSRDPLEMFSQYPDDELLSDIVRETNRFAVQCLAAANSDATWETDLAEIRVHDCHGHQPSSRDPGLLVHQLQDAQCIHILPQHPQTFRGDFTISPLRGQYNTAFEG